MWRPESAATIRFSWNARIAALFSSSALSSNAAAQSAARANSPARRSMSTRRSVSSGPSPFPNSSTAARRKSAESLSASSSAQAACSVASAAPLGSPVRWQINAQRRNGIAGPGLRSARYSSDRTTASAPAGSFARSEPDAPQRRQVAIHCDSVERAGSPGRWSRSGASSAVGARNGGRAGAPQTLHAGSLNGPAIRRAAGGLRARSARAPGRNTGANTPRPLRRTRCRAPAPHHGRAPATTRAPGYPARHRRR